ncbi:MAG: hypothetical protein DSM106950_40605 [Stigonema ocellatum SAG 48.90 = DSM 106950]|nr:hypothetical protein [Stigonema ocellatum SAG 48.90 = DSM 106950]
MKTSTKIFLVIVVGILGLRVSQRVEANQLNRVVAVKPDHSAVTQKTEATDGDGEADDATEPPENEQSEAKENEAKSQESYRHRPSGNMNRL